ncbi:MAG: hypothetical protein H6706_10340 [Myxococcales bacterium]|nr:hypothetical protein [Myxococcales bacterium]
MRTLIALLALAALPACSSSDGKLDTGLKPLEVRCADPTTEAEAWRCGEERTVECTHAEGGTEEAIYVDGGEACNPDDYQLSDAGPYRPGDHVITITQGDDAVCESTLHVVDTVPPVAEPHDVALWSPNHKWHELTPADCADIHDACDADVDVRFTYVTSDEVADGQGDGHTFPDVEGDCQTLRVRAERSGGGDGRVYRIGFRAEDDAGNVTEGECRALVPHDQGGTDAVDSGEAVRLELACD